MREREIERRIFVVGVPRSGTTLVQSLLAAHDEVASSTESHFFDRHFRLVPGMPSRALLVRDPDPEVRSFLQANDALWDDGDPLRWLDDPPERASCMPLPWPPRADAMARRLLELLDDLALCQSRAIWAEKTPAHLRYVPFLERVAVDGPDPRFVHVVRNGLETVASLYQASKLWERAYGVDECARRWNREVRLSLARSGSARDVFVFYEELVTDPEAATRRLFGELDLGWQPDVLERYGEALARVVTPEELWKAGGGRDIEPSPTSRESLTAEHRNRVTRTLRRDLYEELRQRVRP